MMLLTIYCTENFRGIKYRRWRIHYAETQKGRSLNQIRQSKTPGIRQTGKDTILGKMQIQKLKDKTGS